MFNGPHAYSLFDDIEADHTQQRIASRRALALADTRISNKMGRFLRGARNEEEFLSRLDLIRDDFDYLVHSAAEEVGYDHPEYLTNAILSSYRDLTSAEVQFDKTPAEEDEEEDDDLDGNVDRVSSRRTALVDEDADTSFAPMVTPYSSPSGQPLAANPSAQMNFQGANPPGAPGQDPNAVENPLQQDGNEAISPYIANPRAAHVEWNWSVTSDKHWIDKAIHYPGALHRELGVPEGEDIPESKLEEAEHSDNKKERDRAQLAEKLKHMDHHHGAYPGSPFSDYGIDYDYSPEQLAEMRRHLENVADSYREYEDDPEWYDMVPDHELAPGIHRNYEGGLPGFAEDAGWNPDPYGFGTTIAKSRDEDENETPDEYYERDKHLDGDDKMESIDRESSLHTANKYIKHRGDEWVIIQKGTGKVLSHHDSQEKAEEAFRAMEANKHHGSVERKFPWPASSRTSESKKDDDDDNNGNTDLGGPEPKMDKDKHTFDNPKKDVLGDEDKGRWPTKHKDVTEPIIRMNREDLDGKAYHPLEEIGEDSTDRISLPTAKGDEAGFAPGGVTHEDGPFTFKKNKHQVDPVTRKSQD